MLPCQANRHPSRRRIRLSFYISMNYSTGRPDAQAPRLRFAHHSHDRPRNRGGTRQPSPEPSSRPTIMDPMTIIQNRPTLTYRTIGTARAAAHPRSPRRQPTIRISYTSLGIARNLQPPTFQTHFGIFQTTPPLSKSTTENGVRSPHSDPIRAPFSATERFIISTTNTSATMTTASTQNTSK